MENIETYFMPCSIFKSALFSLSSACLFVFFWLFFVVVVFCFVLFCFVLLVFTYFLFCFLFMFFCFCFYVHSYHCLINITRNTPWFVFDSQL